MEKKRFNGVLFPLFSLPSPYGIGTLGKEAYQFIDFLKESHADIWQLLPLTVTSYGDSPYQSPSANGLNPYFLDLDTLKDKGLLTQEEIDSADFGDNEERVNYGLLFNNRITLLKKAYRRFCPDDGFASFVKKGEFHDFAFFMMMKEKHSFAPYYEWGEDKEYSKEIEDKNIREHKDTYLFYLWTQYEFLNEFDKLKDYAHKNGIKLMGDMPLYVARDSVEAYKHPDLFLFDEKHNPTVVSGCPPDAFTADGQLWGNPIYNWAKMKEDDYSWWNKRIQSNLRLYDILRIDHFRGIAAYYTIPFGDKTARNGKWVKGPGYDLFEKTNGLPIIAEDLGYMDDEVRALLKKTGFPGMKVLQFAFGPQHELENLPSNSSSNSVCYTGTHDNEPIKSLYESYDEEHKKEYRDLLKEQCMKFNVPYKDRTSEEITETTVILAYASPSKIAILPFADLLKKGHEARINTPSKLSNENWTYRYKESDFSRELSSFIRKCNEKYGR